MKLKELRKAKRLRLSEVAEYLGVTTATICNYENKVRQPSVKAVEQLAKLYETTADVIITSLK